MYPLFLSSSFRAVLSLPKESFAVIRRRDAHYPFEVEPKACSCAKTALLSYLIYGIVSYLQLALGRKNPLA